MDDNKGFFEIFDGLIAVILIFTGFLLFNLVITVPSDSVSTTAYEFKQSQDIMEQLASKTNITDFSFLDEITNILKDGKDSKNSIRKVSALCEKKFKNLGLTTDYYFTEMNHLNGDKIIASGNIKTADNITTAMRHCGDYCYVLSTY